MSCPLSLLLLKYLVVEVEKKFLPDYHQMHHLNKLDMDIIIILFWDGIDKVLRIRLIIVSLAYSAQPPITLSVKYMSLLWNKSGYSLRIIPFRGGFMSADDRHADFEISFIENDQIKITTEDGSIVTEYFEEVGAKRTTMSPANIFFSAFAL